MTNEEEVERLYLGKPFEDGTEHLYGGLVDLIVFEDEETRQMFLGLPLMNRLMNVESAIGE